MTTKHTIIVHGFIDRAPFTDDPVFNSCDMSKYGYVRIAEVTQEIEFEYPEGWDNNVAQIAALNAQLASLSESCAAQQQPIRARIASLQPLSVTNPKEETNATV